VVPAPRKKRGSLRFLAGFLVFNAWLTLVSGVVMAGMTVLSGAATSALIGAIPTAPSLPSPMPGGMGGGGLSDLGIGMGGPGGGGSALPVATPGDDLKKTLATAMAVLHFGGAVLILLTGVILFICQLGLSQACYVLLDLEEQNARIQETLQMAAARQGGGR
jgi:hypothetical protein